MRAIIADIMKKSVKSIRGEYPDEILNVVNNFSFDGSHIPEAGLNSGMLFRERQINNLLELIYLDLLVQYYDIFDIQDRFESIRRMFEESITANVVHSSELYSKAMDFRALSLRRFEYTDVTHESFNSARNFSGIGSKLDINNGAGILRLPSTKENYATIAKSDVTIEIHSNKVTIVDSSDSRLAYGDDITDPYFVTAMSIGEPDNDITTEYDFEDYNGIIASIGIRYNTTQPITRVSFVPFSIRPLDIVSVFYSNIADPEWEATQYTQIRDIDVTYDTNTVEINFPRVYARELHVFVHQPAYNLVRSDIEIESVLSAKDYIDKVIYNLNHPAPDGFVEHYDINMQLKELIDSIRDKSVIPSEILKPNTRMYVIGLCDIETSNVSYSNYGEYKSQVQPLRGNIHSVSFTQSDNLDRLDEVSLSGVVDACTIFGVSIEDETVYMGNTSSDGRVIDGSVIEANMEYSEGAMIRSSTHPYKFTTHFLPTSSFDNLELYADGELVQLPGTEEKERGSYNASINLPASFAESNNLVDGTVITMRYNYPSIDPFNRTYNVTELNIEDRIGKPNISVYEISDITENYLYIPITSGSISYAPETDIVASEYAKVVISGEIYYQVTENKGITLDGERAFSVGSSYYVHESLTSGPFDSFYYGSIKEVPTYVTISGTSKVFSTETPYIKGSLFVFSSEDLVSSVTEYQTDTVGNILSDDQKSVFSIAQSYDEDDITICYIPASPEATTDYLSSNIAQHNYTEKFTKTTNGKVALSKHTYIDSDILTSPLFDFSDGVFYLKWKYSVTYEPVLVYVNGIKATNITEYRSDMSSKPKFRKTYRDEDYQFYVESGNSLVFNKDITGTIIVYYYKFADVIRNGIEMYRSNYSRDDLSPEIYNYTLLSNIQRI